MYKIRRSEDRGSGDFGWLKAKYTFSFSMYYDPEFVGFRDLLVLNQDKIAPNSGFQPHSHKNMEIVTYIIDGTLEHKDSQGNSGQIRAGHIQRMSAGTGITHSEINPSPHEQTHLLQIWINTQKENVPPSYEERPFEIKKGAQLLVSPDGKDNSATIYQDVYFWGIQLSVNETMSFKINTGRHLWVQVISGQLSINKIDLNEGDGLAMSDIYEFELKGISDCRFLLIDLK